jgi:hypothetical protein
MHLGDIEVRYINAGRFGLDGGAMFWSGSQGFVGIEIAAR